MKTWQRPMAVLVLLAATAGAQGPEALRGESITRLEKEGPPSDELASLGFGRSRLRVVLNERQTVTTQEGGGVVVGDLSFREGWLQAQLPRRFPGLESVDILDRVTARTGIQGLAATRERSLEVIGREESVALARGFIDQVLESGREQLRFRAWLAFGPLANEAASIPVVTVADEATLERRLGELARADDYRVSAPMGGDVANGREAEFAVGKRSAYVSDFRAVAAGSQPIFDPVIGQFEEGSRWKVALLRIPGSDRTVCSAALHLDFARRPFARFEHRPAETAEPLVIQRPVVDGITWNADTIELGGGERGFIVRGLVSVDPDDPEGGLRSLEIICRVGGDSGAKATRQGVVEGFDPDAGLAFVRRAGGDWSPGRKVACWRGGQSIAAGVVRDCVGGLVTVSITEGAPAAGDEVR